MSFRDCIDKAEAGGDIDPARARRIREILDEEVEDLFGSVGPEAAESEGARRAFARLEAEAAESKRRKRLAMARASDIRARILSR